MTDDQPGGGAASQQALASGRWARSGTEVSHEGSCCQRRRTRMAGTQPYIPIQHPPGAATVGGDQHTISPRVTHGSPRWQGPCRGQPSSAGTGDCLLVTVSTDCRPGVSDTQGQGWPAHCRSTAVHACSNRPTNGIGLRERARRQAEAWRAGDTVPRPLCRPAPQIPSSARIRCVSRPVQPMTVCDLTESCILNKKRNLVGGGRFASHTLARVPNLRAPQSRRGLFACLACHARVFSSTDV